METLYTLSPKTSLHLQNYHHPPSLFPHFPTISLTNLPSQKPKSKKPVTFTFHNSTKPLKITPIMASTTPTSQPNKPFSVLFVCLGNICRSPAAEGVFTHLVNQRGLQSNFNIDSAGTIGYHEGNPADPRMRAASKRRGIEITSISRPVRPADFRDFDLILVMDMQNKDDILSALERWRFKETFPVDAHKKVKLMCSYCKKHDETEVPDPYYGGPQGFEKAFFFNRFAVFIAVLLQFGSLLWLRSSLDLSCVLLLLLCAIVLCFAAAKFSVAANLVDLRLLSSSADLFRTK